MWEAAELYLVPEPAPQGIHSLMEGGNTPLRLKEDKCGVVLKVRSEGPWRCSRRCTQGKARREKELGGRLVVKVQAPAAVLTQEPQCRVPTARLFLALPQKEQVCLACWLRFSSPFS